MRNAFIRELVRIVEHEHEREVMLVVGDLGYSVVEPFVERFPDRFINAGVAEQNMAGLAAGMASEGCHVFTYSIANFPTFRCAEQIRNDIDYQDLPVTTVSVGGGLAYGSLGYSHHAVQDYGLMRLMPHMLIAAPGDPAEVTACLRFLASNPCPSYLRLGKAGEPTFHESAPEVAPGRWLPMHRSDSANVAVVSTGAVMADALGWIKKLGLPVDLYSCPLWGMAWKASQLQQANRYQVVVTVEDHLEDGGFGSWMMEALNSSRKRVIPFALDASVCGMVGSQGLLNALGGLSEQRFQMVLRNALT